MQIIIELIVIFVVLSTIIKFFGEATQSTNRKTIISILFFAAIGYAIGIKFAEGWGYFGIVFGGFIGAEYKKEFFEVIHKLYDELIEK